jgi:hypothetical protein
MKQTKTIRKCKFCGVKLPAGQNMRLCDKHLYSLCSKDSCRNERNGSARYCEPCRDVNRAKVKRFALNHPGYSAGYKRKRVKDFGLCSRCMAKLSADMDGKHRTCMNCRESGNPYKLEGL